jgi:dihydrofolate reductase
MTLSIIVAMGKNRELGKNNELLWRIPEDMKHFRDTTKGHTVLMGLKTFQSIGKPLPERKNIILSHDPSIEVDGAYVATSPEEALETAKEQEDEEIFVIGGAMVYSLFLKRVDRLYLTLIDADFPDADVFFPEYEHVFSNVISSRKSQDEYFSYRFIILEK